MEFTYQLTRKPEAVIGKVCALAQDKLLVSGTEKAGRFSGAFEGTYAVDGTRASIKISRKPLFVSWGLVDQGLRYLIA